MARVTVPTGALPGNLDRVFNVPAFCDIGPNNGGGIPNAAWVKVSIVPANPATVQVDSAGRLLHCLWTFARPTVGRGQRRQYAPSAQPNRGTAPIDAQAPINVETDPGTFRIGTDFKLALCGGVPGDDYIYNITYYVTRDEVDPDRAIDVYEPPFKYTLTTLWNNSGGVFIIPENHDKFKPIMGAVDIVNTLGTTRLDVPKWVPLNLGQFNIASAGIYQTKGKL